MAATNVQAFSGDVEIAGNLSVPSGITGVASSATKLATARTIGDVSFDGTANINLPGVNTTGNQDTSGNAATATALETARTINGVSFSGTGNIVVEPFISDNNTGQAETYLVFTTNSTAGYKRLYEDNGLVYDTTNNELLLSSLQIDDWIYHKGDTNTYFGFNAADNFRIVEGGTTALQVLSSGNVGIGTDNPYNFKLFTNGNIFGSTVSLAGGTNVYHHRRASVINNGDCSFQFYLRAHCAWSPGTVRITASMNDGNSADHYAFSWTYSFMALRCDNIYYFSAPSGNLVNSSPGSSFYQHSVNGSSGLLTITVLRNGRDYVCAECEINHYMGFYG